MVQSVQPLFHQRAQGQIIPLNWGMRISFDKAYDDDITFATYDVSSYNDPEYVYAPAGDNPIQQWDKYDYKDFSGRVVDMEWTREVDFPYSVSAAMADFKLNNFDDYFTPDSGSPIDEYILPKRPVRLLAGYNGATTLQQFVGITETTPVRDENAKTVAFHATDFLTEIFDSQLNNVIAMQNVRTDEVLVQIFDIFGLSPSSYVLAKGRNKIPFVFFDRDKNAGNAIRELMQAEMGNLWIDEQGIIRFEPRIITEESPVMLFDDSNVIDIKSTGDDEIINRVKIISDVREVQEYQPIFSNARETGQEWFPSGDSFDIQANSSRPYNANLEDPAISATEPTIGVKNDVSWFTAVTLTGVPVTSGVTVTGSSLNNNQYVVFIQNNNAFPVQIDQMEIWGEPARVIDELRFDAKDQDSINKYEEKVLEINNNFFGTYSNADSFARMMLDSYSEHAPVIEMSVKGDFSLQLGDVIQVSARSYDDIYKITSMTNVMYPYKCTIKARRYKIRPFGVYNVSEYNSGAEYAP